MAKIRITTEQALIHGLLKSESYQGFCANSLAPKIERERRARELLEPNRGGYSKDILDSVFDTADLESSGKRWFGSLLAAPNRNLMLENGVGPLIKWVNEIVFSGHTFQDSLNACSGPLKVKGAGKGLATLLLYLVDPLAYNVCVPATEKGLEILNRMPERRSKKWGAYYAQFNEAAIEFRDQYGLLPQEVDWVLWLIGDNVERDRGDFLVDPELIPEAGGNEPSLPLPHHYAASRPVTRRTSISNRIARDTAIAQAVKRMHSHRCQVCGLRLETPGGPYAEAAHVRPLGSPHDGPDVPENILCLCPTHHVLFDTGAFCIRDDLTILANPELNPPGLGPQLRQVPGHEIATVHFRYHRDFFGFIGGSETEAQSEERSAGRGGNFTYSAKPITLK